MFCIYFVVFHYYLIFDRWQLGFSFETNIALPLPCFFENIWFYSAGTRFRLMYLEPNLQKCIFKFRPFLPRVKPMDQFLAAMVQCIYFSWDSLKSFASFHSVRGVSYIHELPTYLDHILFLKLVQKLSRNGFLFCYYWMHLWRTFNEGINGLQITLVSDLQKLRFTFLFNFRDNHLYSGCLELKLTSLTAWAECVSHHYITDRPDVQDMDLQPKMLVPSRA